MLVTFTSSNSREIMMFAEVAHRLFEIIGKEGTARGVFTREQLPDAIAQLKKAGAEPEAQAADAIKGDDVEQAPKTNLAQRAHPLIELMQESIKEEGGFLMWQAAKDF